MWKCSCDGPSASKRRIVVSGWIHSPPTFSFTTQINTQESRIYNNLVFTLFGFLSLASHYSYQTQIKTETQVVVASGSYTSKDVNWFPVPSHHLHTPLMHFIYIRFVIQCIKHTHGHHITQHWLSLLYIIYLLLASLSLHLQLYIKTLALQRSGKK